jgi:hypothetical protein
MPKQELGSVRATLGNALNHRAAKGCDDRFPASFTGAETDQELRAIVWRLLESCAVAQNVPECPFRPLKGLSYVTLKNVASRFSRETCLEFLAEERACRTHHQGCICQLQKTGIEPVQTVI